jgi:hypothetical protein
MTIKSLLLAGVLTVSTVGFAAAKSYEVSVSGTLKAGETELKPGEYKVKVEGTEAIFTDSSSKTVTLPVKIEKADKKFDITAMETKTENGTKSIEAIRLGGSTMRLVFEGAPVTATK